MNPKTDRTGWIIFTAVLGAFILLICAWVFFFWLAAQNRVADVALETAPPAKSAEIREPASAENPAQARTAQASAIAPVPATEQAPSAAQAPAHSVTDSPVSAPATPDNTSERNVTPDIASERNAANGQAAQ